MVKYSSCTQYSLGHKHLIRLKKKMFSAFIMKSLWYSLLLKRYFQCLLWEKLCLPEKLFFLFSFEKVRSQSGNFLVLFMYGKLFLGFNSSHEILIVSLFCLSICHSVRTQKLFKLQIWNFFLHRAEYSLSYPKSYIYIYILSYVILIK